MASLANSPFQTVRATSRTNDDTADPFWQATPRSIPAATIVPLMAVQQTTPPVQQAQAAHPTKQIRQGPPPGAVRRPQCTHMTMQRRYGPFTCLMCGKIPNIGWLYVCQQDRDIDQDRVPEADPDAFPIVPDDSGYFEMQARLAESLGMGNSVIKGIRNRDYSLEQVDKLVEQKKHMLAMIRKQENPSTSSTPQPQHATGRLQTQAESIIASVGASANTAVQAAQIAVGAAKPAPSAETPSNTPAKRIAKGKKTGCNFQVCHSCRPFFQDRIYLNLDKVFSGTVPAVTEAEITRLPFLDPAVVRNLGLRQPPTPPQPSPKSPESLDITAAHQTDGYEEDTSDWTPTSATSGESDSEQLDGTDPYPCPGPGHCPVWSREGGCAYDDGFNDGLRSLNHGFGPDPDLSRMTPENSLSRLRRVRGSISDTPGGSTSTGSSISLPTPSTIPLTPLTPLDGCFEDALTMRLGKPGKAATICGPLHRGGRRGLGVHGNESNSSVGSEIEVEGGVALTEEAVRSGVPDILTDE